MSGWLGNFLMWKSGKTFPEKPPKVNDSLSKSFSGFSPFSGFAGFPVDGFPKNLLWVMGLGVGGIIILIRRRGKHVFCCRGDYKAFIQQLVLAPPGPASPSSPRALKNLKFAVKDAYFLYPFPLFTILPFLHPKFQLTQISHSKHRMYDPSKFFERPRH